MKSWTILNTIIFIMIVPSVYGSNSSLFWLASMSTSPGETAGAATSEAEAKEIPKEVTKLINQLDHQNKMMQYAAAQELGQFGKEAEAAIPKLREKIYLFLSNPDAEYEDLATARAAAQSLGDIGIADPKTIELLQSLAEWAEREDQQMLRVSKEALERLKE